MTTTIERSNVQSIPFQMKPEAGVTLEELFIYTSLVCNKTCRHCFVSSSPTNRTLDDMTLGDLEGVFAEAAQLGVGDIYFTGGEPFLNKDILPMISAALELAPITIYTNGTEPLDKALRGGLIPINDQHRKKHGRSMLLRISLDHYDADIHDVYYGRGAGAYEKAVSVAETAATAGFDVAINAQADIHNLAADRQVERQFSDFFFARGVELTDVKVLPDIPTGAEASRLEGVDESPVSPAEFTAAQTRPGDLMCGVGRTVLKLDGQLQVFPCTLIVPDSPEAKDQIKDYVLGKTLGESLKNETPLSHPACRAYCIKGGMSCANR